MKRLKALLESINEGARTTDQVKTIKDVKYFVAYWKDPDSDRDRALPDAFLAFVTGENNIKKVLYEIELDDEQVDAAAEEYECLLVADMDDDTKIVWGAKGKSDSDKVTIISSKN